jgi:V/A-type H+-transporting ATPase subunit I
MLKTTRMTRVMIAGTKDIMEPTLSELHKLNVLHITDYLEENADFKIGKPFKSASRHSEHLLSLRTIASQLGIAGSEPARKQSAKELPLEIDEKITKLQKDVAARFDELRSIESRIKEKEDLISAVKPFLGLPLSLDSYHGYDTVKVFTGYIGIDLEPKISGITKNFELFIGDFEKRPIFALFIPLAFAEEVQKIFQEERTYVEGKSTGHPG